MIQKPEKPQAPAGGAPTSGSEITWVIVFLAFCMMANSWLLANAHEQASAKAAKLPAAEVETPAPTIVPERPSRERPSRDADRPWRDPSNNVIPSF